MTRRTRWMALAVVPLIGLVIAVHVAGLAIAAAALTPLAGIVLVAMGLWVVKARDGG